MATSLAMLFFKINAQRMGVCHKGQGKEGLGLLDTQFDHCPLDQSIGSIVWGKIPVTTALQVVPY